ncbi:hypothetical protein JX265_009803 [Neoarthrinium moseri]|uniref:AB hydrolase-1 domain-containing protein n=1 Tax=Neoarthrinium moseri TaxID=1658444 RepID=A0A9Q0AMF1_9PEZI|nr:hypothetical protein JX265_009803 [Neoarthrinium moseri]
MAAASQAKALVPDDPSVQHLDAKIGPYNYHYMLSSPPSPVATVLLVHGWPDLGMAWRYQVPFLTSLGLRVIVPDMLGYGRTSAPADFEEYSLKKLSGHLAQLVEQVVGKGEKVILGGHDWGAALVWRLAMWHPEITMAVFSLNVPYTAPHKQYADLETVAKLVPSFRYQLQLASPETERIVAAKPERLRQFINTLYGGATPEGQSAFSTAEGLLEDRIDQVGPAKLMSAEMVDFYVREYSRNGLHGPTNWYRTRKPNFDEEKPLADIEGGYKFKVPAMVVMGEKDIALPPKLADGMEVHFENRLRKEVAKGVGHWAMWQDPEAINKYIGEFLGSVLGDKIKGKL